MTTNPANGNSAVEYALKSESGQTGKYALWLTDKAKWKLAEFTRILGIPNSLRVDFQYEEAIGRQFLAVVILNEKGYAEVHEYRPAPGVTPTPSANRNTSAPVVTPAAPPKPATPPVPKPQTAAAAVTDATGTQDDLPF
jgi:hypothetical protein